MAEDINWFDGERLASRLRTAKEQLLHWQDRKPAEATDEVPTANLEGENLYLIRMMISLVKKN